MEVAIRRFEKKDILDKIRWINDGRNNQYLHYEFPLTYEKTLRWFQNIQGNKQRYDAVIECDGTGVGIIGLLEIKEQKAEYYITLGEQGYGGKGIAKKATELLLEYAFSCLGLEEIYLYTETSNIRAQKLFTRCGFRQIGLLKKSVMNRENLVDRYLYQIQAKEFWQERKAEQRFCETPIQKLSDEKNAFYVKREDLYPFSFGGNKARKALYFFQEMDAGNYNCVVTYGSSSSNHCRVVANLAAARNMPCYVIGAKEASIPTFNSQMMELFGAELSFVPVEEVSHRIERKLQELTETGKKPYFIPGGGHNILGTQAYVDCYEEIRRYEIEHKIHFDYIFFASGTGTTQAGLICGQWMRQDDRRIVGISIARKNPRGRQVVLDSVYEYLSEKEIPYTEEEIQKRTIFEDSYAGSGYGGKTEEIRKTIRNMMIQFGIPMDAVYTAKAYQGMEAYIKAHGIEEKKILFIHTGGTPLFFDSLLELEKEEKQRK